MAINLPPIGALQQRGSIVPQAPQSRGRILAAGAPSPSGGGAGRGLAGLGEGLAAVGEAIQKSRQQKRREAFLQSVFEPGQDERNNAMQATNTSAAERLAARGVPRNVADMAAKAWEAGDKGAAWEIAGQYLLAGPESVKASDLVQTVGPDGRPVYTRASQAVGQTAYTEQSAPTPRSDMAKLKADLDAGLITEGQYREGIQRIRSAGREKPEDAFESPRWYLDTLSRAMRGEQVDPNMLALAKAEYTAPRPMQDPATGQMVMMSRQLPQQLSGQPQPVPAQGQPATQASGNTRTVGGVSLTPVESAGPSKSDSEKIKSGQATIGGLETAVSNYRRLLNQVGPSVYGEDKARLNAAYWNVLMQYKEALNLGVLNGPDLEVMQQMISNPTELGTAFMESVGLGGLDAQLDVMDQYIQGFKQNLQTTYGGGQPATRQQPGTPSAGQDGNVDIMSIPLDQIPDVSTLTPEQQRLLDERLRKEGY